MGGWLPGWTPAWSGGPRPTGGPGAFSETQGRNMLDARPGTLPVELDPSVLARRPSRRRRRQPTGVPA